MAGRAQQTLRIIGGQWRGRQFQFPAVGHLRPTPDRVRETLFNWLGPYLDGARCLDLFCGSGALGLEALSRGAGEVSFVDTSREVIQFVKETSVKLKSKRANFFHGQAAAFLNKNATPYDIIFLDPPYDLDLIPATAKLLQAGNCLKPDSWVYVEHDGRLDLSSLPSNWHVHREKKAGQVHYSLYQVQA